MTTTATCNSVQPLGSVPRLEARRRLLRHTVLDLGQVDAERELGGHVRERVARGLRGEGTRARETRVHLQRNKDIQFLKLIIPSTHAHIRTHSLGGQGVVGLHVSHKQVDRQSE